MVLRYPPWRLASAIVNKLLAKVDENASKTEGVDVNFENSVVARVDAGSRATQGVPI